MEDNSKAVYRKEADVDADIRRINHTHTIATNETEQSNQYIFEINEYKSSKKAENLSEIGPPIFIVDISPISDS